jgi:hypothetical protein
MRYAHPNLDSKCNTVLTDNTVGSPRPSRLGEGDSTKARMKGFELCSLIGCDFHSSFQQIAMLDPTTGEVIERRLEHENGEAKKFYATLPSPARVGMEATCDAQSFERTLREHHHELWIGDAAEIRAASGGGGFHGGGSAGGGHK